GSEPAAGAAGAADDPACPDVVIGHEPEQVAHDDRVAEGRLQQPHERGRGRDGLEAAAVATAAEDPVGLHLHVADLAREPGRAAMDAPAKHDARADPGPELDVDEVVEPAPGAE